MSKIYTKLDADEPIRPDDVHVSGALYVALGVTDDSASADSTLYDYTEKRIDYYYSKDDNNLKAVVGKVEITASDNYIIAKKIKYIETVKTHVIGEADTIMFNGAPYVWKATGTTAGAGAWADVNDNPVTFTYEIDENILDARISVVGTTYTKNYLWLKNIIENAAVGSTIPTTQETGTGSLDTPIGIYMSNAKVLNKASATQYTAEKHTGVLKCISNDVDDDHEGSEINVKYTIFVSATNEYDAKLEIIVATIDYELAQALDAMNAGDKIDMDTLDIS